MLAKVWSAAVSGVDAYSVEVEVDSGFGDSVTVVTPNKTANLVCRFRL